MKEEIIVLACLGFFDSDEAEDEFNHLVRKNEPHPAWTPDPSCVYLMTRAGLRGYLFDSLAAHDVADERFTPATFDTHFICAPSQSVIGARAFGSVETSDYRGRVYNTSLLVRGQRQYWPNYNVRQFSPHVRESLAGGHDCFVSWAHPETGIPLQSFTPDWVVGDPCLQGLEFHASRHAAGALVAKRVLVDWHGMPSGLETVLVLLDMHWSDSDPARNDLLRMRTRRLSIVMPVEYGQFVAWRPEMLPVRFRQAYEQAMRGFEENCEVRGMDLIPRLVEGEVVRERQSRTRRPQVRRRA